MIEKQCINCGNSYMVKPCRVDIAKFCSTACNGEYTKKHSGSMRICPICGKEFYAAGNPKHTMTYCSRQCAGIARRKGKVIICDNCGKSVYKSPAFLVTPVHHFCSIKCANEWQGRNKIQYVCKICGKDFAWSPSRGQDYPVKYCSQNCRDKDPEHRKHMIRMNVIQQQNGGLNNLELVGRQILKDAGIEFKEQVLMYDKFCVDVLLSDYPVIIQWDGDYWHGNPVRFPELDKRQIRRSKLDKSQDAYLSKCGYEVLRFWESDVKKYPDKVTARIKGVLDDYNKRTISSVT